MFWRFDYGDGTVVEVPNSQSTAGYPMLSTHVYTEPGEYTVTLSAIDADSTPRPTVETPYGDPDIESGPWPGSWQSFDLTIETISTPAFQVPAGVRPSVSDVYTTDPAWSERVGNVALTRSVTVTITPAPVPPPPPVPAGKLTVGGYASAYYI